MRRDLSLRFDFLDQQIVDADAFPVGRVEDVELDFDGDADSPRITALLTGMEALGQRVEGALGGSLAATAGRLREPASEEGPTRVDAALIGSAGPKVELTVRLAELPHVAPLERWLSRRLVARIPGAGDARE